LFVQGDIVTLYGGGSSDLNENIYSYTWYQSAGDPIVTLNDADTPTPSFVAPLNMMADTTLTLQFELIITDMGRLLASFTIPVPLNTESSNLSLARFIDIYSINHHIFMIVISFNTLVFICSNVENQKRDRFLNSQFFLHLRFCLYCYHNLL
jgi:K319-like protein